MLPFVTLDVYKKIGYWFYTKYLIPEKRRDIELLIDAECNGRTEEVNGLVEKLGDFVVRV